MNRQFLILFFASLVIWTIGNGLLPLLPVYVTHLGAQPSFIGTYLSFSYFALAGGTIIAGQLSDRTRRRKPFLIVAGMVISPLLWFMSEETTLSQLTVLTAAVWLLGGLGIALIYILAGLQAGERERGKIFGILSLTGGLGLVIGGIAFGYIADRWGYSTLFLTIAIFALLVPFLALFLEEKRVPQALREEIASAEGKSHLSRTFSLLLLASTVGWASLFTSRLGTSLAMNHLGFTSTAISGTAAIGAAVTLPLLPLVGWLSDRFARKRLMILCCLSGAAGLLLLAGAKSLSHFLFAASLLSLWTASGGVGSALVVDLVPRKTLGTAMSLFTATTWLGGIVGFAGAGFAIQSLGTAVTFAAGSLLPLLGILLLMPVPGGQRGAGAQNDGVAQSAVS